MNPNTGFNHDLDGIDGPTLRRAFWYCASSFACDSTYAIIS